MSFGIALDVRTTEDFYAVHFFNRSGINNHIVIDEEFFGHFNLSSRTKTSRVCKYAVNCRNSRSFRRYKINLTVCRSASAFKVTVECSE
jgi:hypothetical protein